MPNPANKPVIAVDIDDVLAPYVPGLIEHHNLEYGSTLTYEGVLDLDLSKSAGIDKEEFLKRAWFYVINHQKTALPVKGSQEAINKLKANYAIYVITFRSKPLYEVTHYWLGKHFKDIFEDVIMIGGEKFGEHPKTKAEVCQEIGA